MVVIVQVKSGNVTSRCLGVEVEEKYLGVHNKDGATHRSRRRRECPSF